MHPLAVVLGVVLTALASVLAALHLFFQGQYRHWKERGVPHAEPRFPLGNLEPGKSLADLFIKLYKTAAGLPYFGFWFLHRAHLMVNDLDLIQHILVKDFSAFPNHGNYFNEKDDPLAGHLFSVDGQRWKNLRAKLSPTFTSSKMKGMFPIFYKIAEKLQQVVLDSADTKKPVDIKNLISSYNLDVIGACAYGLDTGVLGNDDTIFSTMSRRIFMSSWGNSIRNTLVFLLPTLAEKLRVVRTEKQVSEFFLNLFRETIEFRKKNNVVRKDVMQLLIELMDKGYVDDLKDKEAAGDPFTLGIAAANAFIFFSAGFETSTSVAHFIMYELAKNMDIQERLRAEILQQIKKDGEMSYDGIFSMKYLDKVISEGLRMYPPAPILMRKAARDYQLPGTDYTVEKNTQVYISMIAIQNDPKYFPNPEQFDPERFNEEEKAKRHPFTYMPFGEGPRICIGYRFAQMLMRTSIVALLSRYRFELAPSCPRKLPFDPKSFIAIAKDHAILKVTHLA